MKHGFLILSYTDKVFYDKFCLCLCIIKISFLWPVMYNGDHLKQYHLQRLQLSWKKALNSQDYKIGRCLPSMNLQFFDFVFRAWIINSTALREDEYAGIVIRQILIFFAYFFTVSDLCMLALSIMHQNLESELWRSLDLDTQILPRKYLNTKESLGFLFPIIP